MGFWLPNKCFPIALDLGTDSVKLLQLQKVGQTLFVSACGRWEFPKYAAEDPKQRRELAVAAVRDMLREGGFRGRRAISALSCAQLNIKNVRMPHMPEHELVEALRWEAKERFDFDPLKDQMSILNAGQVRSGNETRDEVIVFLAHHETVEDHLAMLGEMGLVPEHVDAEPIALFRVFERFLRRRADEQAVSAIADVGRSATRVVIARGRDIIFIKSIDIGGRKLTDAVAKQLNLDVAEADELRMRTMREHAGPSRGDEASAGREATSVDWTIHDAVRGEVEALAKEIALCLRYCSVTFRGLRLERITVTGGEAYDPALIKLLNEQMDIECVVGQPLRGMDVSGVDLGGDRRASLTEWATCTGMAIRGIDFPHTVQEAEHGEDRLSA